MSNTIELYALYDVRTIPDHLYTLLTAEDVVIKDKDGQVSNHSFLEAVERERANFENYDNLTPKEKARMRDMPYDLPYNRPDGYFSPLEFKLSFKHLDEVHQTGVRYSAFDIPRLRYIGWLEDWPMPLDGKTYAIIHLQSLKLNFQVYSERIRWEIKAIESLFALCPPLYAHSLIDNVFPGEIDNLYRDNNFETWKAQNLHHLQQPGHFYSDTMVFGPELVSRYNLKACLWENTKVCYHKWIREDMLWVASDYGYKSDFGKHSYMNAKRANILYGSELHNELAGITNDEIYTSLDTHIRALEKTLPFDFVPNSRYWLIR